MVFPFLRTSVATVRSLTAYLAVSLYVLAVGPPGMLWAVLVRSPALLYWLGRQGVRLALAITGIHFRSAGLEHVQAGHAAVYAVNHTSNVEPPILYLVLEPLFPRLRILYKAELHKVPILSHVFDLAGFVPVDRHHRDRARRAIEAAAVALREGNSFLIFPEGTRSRTGELLPFKKGGFIMAIEGQVLIVPMAIQGAGAAMRRGSPIIWPVTVSVRIGPPIPTAGRGLGDRDELITQTRSAIQELLAQGPVR